MNTFVTTLAISLKKTVIHHYIKSTQPQQCEVISNHYWKTYEDIAQVFQSCSDFLSTNSPGNE